MGRYKEFFTAEAADAFEMKKTEIMCQKTWGTFKYKIFVHPKQFYKVAHSLLTERHVRILDNYLSRTPEYKKHVEAEGHNNAEYEVWLKEKNHSILLYCHFPNENAGTFIEHARFAMCFY